ncbi:MAG: LysM peptidoglycan-binding domain-containing protein [Alistipes sp.]|nr:LysM peptidoglycan-binding domain-containing protein [Alistipes sp.]
MKRVFIAFLSCVLSVGIVCTIAANEVKRSHTIVYINGAKFYVHTVKAGDTLYSLSKIYGVEQQNIIAHNPSTADGLKLDQTIKIPVKQSQIVEKKRKKKDFEYHTVVASETLYSISKRYGISIETILEDNSGIDPAHISIGTRLYIRRSEMGQTPEKQVQNEWEEYKENLNAVTTDGHTYYIVQAGDTLYSLCKRFGTDEQTMRSLNDLSEGLKAGALIKVPNGKAQAEPQNSPNVVLNKDGELQSTDNQAQIGGEEAYAQLDSLSSFTPLHGSDTLRIALMLPMTRNGVANNNFADFYKGFLLGLEQVKGNGHQVELTLYDTEMSAEGAAAIVENEFGANCPDMIVGPVYETQLDPVIRFAESKSSLPVISPLAIISEKQTSPVLFQMAPSPKYKYEKVKDLFSEERNVTLIYSENIDTEFEREILEQLKGRTYTTHKYEYEHPSIIEAREKERQKLREKGVEVPDEPISPSDMSPLLQQEGDNTLIILANTETETDRILTAIASANISLRAKTGKVASFIVLGNPKWNRYNNIDRSILFQDNVVMLSSYHARRDDERVYEFDRRFITEFGSMPTLFAYRGYDTAVIFGNGAFSEDFRGAMCGKCYTPLMTPYTFKGHDTLPDGTTTDIQANQEWVRINYHKNYTITTQ